MSQNLVPHTLIARITDIIVSLSGNETDFKKEFRFNVEIDQDDDFAFTIFKGQPLRKAQVVFREGTSKLFGELSYCDESSCEANFLCERSMLEQLNSYRNEYIGGLITFTFSEDQKAIRFASSFSLDGCDLEWDLREGHHVPVTDFRITLRYNQAKTL